MATITDLKKLLAAKYGKTEADIDDDAQVSDIVGDDTNLPAYLKEKFGKEYAASDLEGAPLVSDLVKIL